MTKSEWANHPNHIILIVPWLGALSYLNSGPVPNRAAMKATDHAMAASIWRPTPTSLLPPTAGLAGSKRRTRRYTLRSSKFASRRPEISSAKWYEPDAIDFDGVCPAHNLILVFLITASPNVFGSDILGFGKGSFHGFTWCFWSVSCYCIDNFVCKGTSEIRTGRGCVIFMCPEFFQYPVTNRSRACEQRNSVTWLDRSLFAGIATCTIVIRLCCWITVRSRCTTSRWMQRIYRRSFVAYSLLLIRSQHVLKGVQDEVFPRGHPN
jgi:hypothetical protein